MRNKLYSALRSSLLAKLFTYIIQFVALAFYARIFTPEEFGIIASIQVFVIFFQLLSDIGIGPAIISQRKLTPNQRDGIFSVTLIIGISVSLLFYVFSYWLNYFYGGYEYQKIAILVCIMIFFTTLNIMPKTALTIDVKFKMIGAIDIISEVMAFITVMILFEHGYGVIALATRPAVQAIIRFFMSLYIARETSFGMPKLGPELFHFRKIMSFSLYQFGFNIVNYFSRNLDNILIAKYFGMSVVGIYDKSYQLMRYPLLLSTSAIAPAIQPVLTKYRDNPTIIVIEHNILAKRLFVFSLFLSLYIFTNSNDIVLFLFGTQWMEVTPIIEILSSIIPIQAVLSSSGSFYQVMNKPKLLFYVGIRSSVVTVIAIIIGIYLDDIKSVAYCICFAYAFNFFQIYYFLFKICFKSDFCCFLLELARSFFVSLIPMSIYVLGTILLEYYGFEFDVFYSLSIKFILISIIVLSFRKYILNDLKMS